MQLCLLLKSFERNQCYLSQFILHLETQKVTEHISIFVFDSDRHRKGSTAEVVFQQDVVAYLHQPADFRLFLGGPCFSAFSGNCVQECCPTVLFEGVNRVLQLLDQDHSQQFVLAKRDYRMRVVQTIITFPFH